MAKKIVEYSDRVFITVENMKILLPTLLFALLLASCSSGQVTKEQILAKHLDGKKLELENERKPASKQKSHHFRTAIENVRIHNNYL